MSILNQTYFAVLDADYHIAQATNGTPGEVLASNKGPTIPLKLYSFQAVAEEARDYFNGRLNTNLRVVEVALSVVGGQIQAKGSDAPEWVDQYLDTKLGHDEDD